MIVLTPRKARPVRSSLYTFHKVYQTCKREERRLAHIAATEKAQAKQAQLRAEITLAVAPWEEVE